MSFKYREFQRQDFARFALHDGAIGSLDTGLGKSVAAYTYGLLKCGYDAIPELQRRTLTATDGPETYEYELRVKPQAPILLVVPGDLHWQMIREGREKLRVDTLPITSQEDFLKLTKEPDSPLTRMTADGRPIVPPGFYITSYTQLCTNNVPRMPDALDYPNPRHLLALLCLPEVSGVKCQVSGEPVDGQEHRDLTRDTSLPDTFASVRHLFTWRDRAWRSEYDLLQIHRDETRPELDRAYARECAALEQWEDQKAAANHRKKLEAAYDVLKNLFTYRPDPTYKTLTLAQQDFVIREFCRRKLADYAEGEGSYREFPVDKNKPEGAKRRIKCVYAPSLSDLCWNAFDCVEIDEGVKMKGEDTYVGRGVRQMDPKYRAVWTATPIKNRLPDIFRLAWWAAGGRAEAHARFLYKDESKEREAFAKKFLVSERNLTKEKEAKKVSGAKGQVSGGLTPRTSNPAPNSRYTKLTAEICNIHLLWKLLAPIVLRRRKDECGEDIVPRIRKVVRCEMGREQKAVYRYHLEAPYLDINGQRAVGAQLTALRIAAVDPTTSSLQNKGIVQVPCECVKKVSGAKGQVSGPDTPHLTPRTSCPLCRGSGKVTLPHVASNWFNPKFASVLSLVQEIIARNEQVLIGTAFNEAQDHLGELLREAGVPFILADGRLTPAKRGPLLQRFRHGEAPVCLAGVESCANGHNLDTVSNVIIYGYSWAYDLIKQFLDRVHRLTSKKPINVYLVIVNGTIDRRLESLNWEKADAVELALDGRLIGERTEEVNLAQLLQIARDEFNVDDVSVDEQAIQREWPALRAKLQTSATAWLASRRPKSTVHSPQSTVHRPSSPTQDSGLRTQDLLKKPVRLLDLTTQTMHLKHTTGRVGEPQEYIEYETPNGERWLTQRSGTDWIIYHIKGDDATVLASRKDRAEAVRVAEQFAREQIRNAHLLATPSQPDARPALPPPAVQPAAPVTGWRAELAALAAKLRQLPARCDDPWEQM